MANSSDIEVMLDILVAGAAAPGANIVVYFAPDLSDQSFLNVMSAAIHDSVNKPSIISLSWGGSEEACTEQFRRDYDELLQSAASLGITVCVASGDNGSADQDAGTWDGNAHVDFPASSPFALSCGGTKIDVSGAPGNAIVGESVWHDGPNDGTGGGVSRFFPLPDYQQSAAVPAARNPAGNAGRGVPDVAANAAPSSGYQIVCGGHLFPDPIQGVPPAGGTSAVAPLWAGLIARINQRLGKPVGFINPVLYRIPPDAAAFRDITDGNNGDYQAAPGWDACTGLGSPRGKNLVKVLLEM